MNQGSVNNWATSLRQSFKQFTTLAGMLRADVDTARKYAKIYGILIYDGDNFYDQNLEEMIDEWQWSGVVRQLHEYPRFFNTIYHIPGTSKETRILARTLKKRFMRHIAIATRWREETGF